MPSLLDLDSKAWHTAVTLPFHRRPLPSVSFYHLPLPHATSFHPHTLPRLHILPRTPSLKTPSSTVWFCACCKRGIDDSHRISSDQSALPDAAHEGVRDRRAGRDSDTHDTRAVYYPSILPIRAEDTRNPWTNPWDAVRALASCLINVGRSDNTRASSIASPCSWMRDYLAYPRFAAADSCTNRTSTTPVRLRVCGGLPCLLLHLQASHQMHRGEPSLDIQPLVVRRDEPNEQAVLSAERTETTPLTVLSPGTLSCRAQAPLLCDGSHQPLLAELDPRERRTGGYDGGTVSLTVSASIMRTTQCRGLCLLYPCFRVHLRYGCSVRRCAHVGSGVACDGGLARFVFVSVRFTYEDFGGPVGRVQEESSR